MNRLTARQQSIYNFIRECMISRGYGPTVREIGQQMEIKSPNGVMCHLRALERKGVIHRSANKSRAIELAEPLRQAEVTLEVQGWLKGGVILKRAGAIERLALTQILGNDQNFLIEVADNSLVDHEIDRGDKIVLRKFGVCEPGQIILGTHSDSHDPFLGQVQFDDDRLLVKTFAPNSKALAIRDVNVLGVAIGLIRLFPSGLSR